MIYFRKIFFPIYPTKMIAQKNVTILRMQT